MCAGGSGSFLEFAMNAPVTAGVFTSLALAVSLTAAQKQQPRDIKPFTEKQRAEVVARWYQDHLAAVNKLGEQLDRAKAMLANDDTADEGLRLLDQVQA